MSIGRPASGCSAEAAVVAGASFTVLLRQRWWQEQALPTLTGRVPDGPFLSSPSIEHQTSVAAGGLHRTCEAAAKLLRVPAGGRQTSSPLLVAHALPRDWSLPAGSVDGLRRRPAFDRL